jgi:WD40 repeat protein
VRDPEGGLAYDGFASYGSARDGPVAADIEAFLESFHENPLVATKYRRKLELCRDGSDFTFPARRQSDEPQTAMREIIRGYQALSRCLVVFVGPETRRHPWVVDELELWFEAGRPAASVLVCLTHGDPAAQPPEEIYPEPVLRHHLHLPFVFDLRGFDRRLRRSVRPRPYEEERIRLAAALLGPTVSKDDLIEGWRIALAREQRRARRRRTTLVSVFGLVAITLALFAWRQRDTAVEQRLMAESNAASLRSDAVRALDPVAALSLALKAYDLARTQNALNALRRSIDQVGVRRSVAAGVALPTSWGGTMPVWDVSADRRRIAIAADGDSIDVFDTTTLDRVARLAGRRPNTSAVAVSPSGSLVAEADGTATVLILAAGTAPRRIDAVHAATRLMFDPTERKIALIGSGEISFHNLSDGRRLSRVPLVPRALDFSTDGARAVLTISNLAKIVSTETGEILTELDLRSEVADLPPFANGSDRVLMGRAYFLGGDERLLTVGSHGPARMWDARTGAQLFTQQLLMPSGADRALLPSDGSFALLVDDSEIEQWRPGTSRNSSVSFAPRHQNLIEAADLSPAGQQAATFGSEGSIRIWSVAEARPIIEWRTADRDILDIRFTPRGDRLLTVARDGRLQVHDATALREAGRIEIVDPMGDGYNYLSDAALIGDGTTLMTRSVSGPALIQNLATGSTSFKGVVPRPSQASVSNDGRFLAILADEGVASAEAGAADAEPHLRVWDLAQNRSFAWPTRSPLGARFAPTGTHLALHGFSGSIELIDAAQGTRVALAEIGRRLVKHVNFSSDGARLVAATDNGAAVVDVATGHVISRVAVGGAVETAALGAVDGRVYTAHADHTVRVWDSSTGRTLTLRGHNQRPSGFREFDAGRLLLTWGDDALLILWNAEDGTLLRRFETHRDAVIDATLVEGGLAILSIGRSGFLWYHRCDACRGEVDLLSLARQLAGPQ